MNMKIFWFLPLVALVGCAHKVDVESTSAAHEIRSDKILKTPAYVYISPEVANLERIAKSGHVCGAHTYPVSMGPALRTSILKTVEGGYSSVVSLNNRNDAKNDGPLFTFGLDEYTPRLRFVMGFFVGTADASADLALKATAYAADGKEVASTTVRGSGQDSEDGDCPVGATVLGRASQKAIRVSLENFVSRVINRNDR